MHHREWDVQIWCPKVKFSTVVPTYSNPPLKCAKIERASSRKLPQHWKFSFKIVRWSVLKSNIEKSHVWHVYYPGSFWKATVSSIYSAYPTSGFATIARGFPRSVMSRRTSWKCRLRSRMTPMKPVLSVKYRFFEIHSSDSPSTARRPNDATNSRPIQHMWARGMTVCRYNWHSAVLLCYSLGLLFPMLEYKYDFQMKYTEANSTRKLLWFEITKIPTCGWPLRL